MPTFTSYWQNNIKGNRVRGHHARLKALENGLIKLGWERTENSDADLALFDIFDEDYGIEMVRSSYAPVKVWIGNRSAQNLQKILMNESINIYADQDWNSRGVVEVANNKYFVNAPIVDEDFLDSIDKTNREVADTTVLIPGGNKERFMELVSKVLPMHWNRSDVVVVENMDREELMNLCFTAGAVYCTPSVVAMELFHLGIVVNLVLTSVDQIGNYINPQNASYEGFSGNVEYLAKFINNYYHHKQEQK